MAVFRFTPDGQTRQSWWRTIQGRSHCDSCRRTLQWFELIPIVSFVWLRGMCRSCKAKLSWQYPIVELITGGAFALIAWRITSLLPFHMPFAPAVPAWWVMAFVACWWVIAALGIALSVYDILYYLIPNVLLYALIGAACAAQIISYVAARTVPAFPETGMLFSGNFAYVFGAAHMSLARIAIGLVCALAVIGGAFAVSRGRSMGFGDVLIAAAWGIAFGWPDIMIVLFVAFVSGTLVSVGLLWARKKTMKSMVPFGPFLIFGALTTVVAGDTLVTAYMRIFPNLFL